MTRVSGSLTRRRMVFGGAGAAALVLSAAGCAGPGAGEGGQQAGSGAAPAVGNRDVTLQFMYGGEPTVPDTHRAMSEPFTQRYPKVKVEHVHVSSQYVDKVLNLMVAGTPPDVFWAGGSDMIEFADRGMLLPLRPLMRRDKLETSDLYPAALAHYEWKGEQYGLPRDWAARILFYNVDAFKKAGVRRPAATWKDLGWTWDAFLEAARKLTVREGDQVSQYGADVQGGYRIWSAWPYNNGGQIVDTTRMACRMSDAPTVEALQFLQDAIHKHRVAVPRDVLQKEGARNLFVNGRVAIQEGTYGYMVPYKNFQLFEWDIAYMPVNHRREASVGGGGVCFMAAKAGKFPEEAWAFLKHLIAFDTQLVMARMGGGASCLRRVMSHADVARQRPPEHFNIFVEAGDHVKIDPPVLRWSQINGVINKEFADLWDGKRTAKDVAAAICQGIEPYLAEPRR
ncbi:MAG: sugar ABC transporter substrate-binding protein [Chloroflexi bacterium]|nr:sugar ABC transporter substrate-binding protein [Chloroflexota bacterium]